MKRKVKGILRGQFMSRKLSFESNHRVKLKACGVFFIFWSSLSAILFFQNNLRLYNRDKSYERRDFHNLAQNLAGEQMGNI